MFHLEKVGPWQEGEQLAQSFHHRQEMPQVCECTLDRVDVVRVENAEKRRASVLAAIQPVLFVELESFTDPGPARKTREC
jgi:hypothetical protein